MSNPKYGAVTRAQGKIAGSPSLLDRAVRPSPSLGMSVQRPKMTKLSLPSLYVQPHIKHDPQSFG